MKKIRLGLVYFSIVMRSLIVIRWLWDHQYIRKQHIFAGTSMRILEVILNKIELKDCNNQLFLYNNSHHPVRIAYVAITATFES